MIKPAYYNEIDPYVAQWMRNLIKAKHIADGDVDERSIADVRPSDLTEYTQCHFFAGLGGWSYALRLAGWPDTRHVWTASCPCQPFSAAGKGDGFDDERHLWPHLDWLIQQCRPAIIVGEQVASKDADPWVDLVQTDLEGMGYAFGAVAFPSAGVGAPHIRDRTYWVAHAGMSERRPQDNGGTTIYGEEGQRLESANRFGERSAIGRMGDDDDDTGLERLGSGHQAEGGRHGTVRPVAEAGESCGVGNANGSIICGNTGASVRAQGEGGNQSDTNDACASSAISRPGPTNGFWRDADWLFCRDGNWRPVEPGTFPLADGATARVGRLRAYGNAINVEAAKTFIECVRECRP